MMNSASISSNDRPIRAKWTHYSSYHEYPHLTIHFGSPFGRYPTFHTLTSVGRKKAFSMLKEWASGQVVRALDCCAKHRWFEPNPRIIVGMLAHCSPSSKWVPGGNTKEVKGGEERNWPPYLTMPTAQDKCPL